MTARWQSFLVRTGGTTIRLQLVALIAVTAAVYLNSFPGAFHYDDFPLLLENARVNASSFDYGAFLSQYGGRPLTMWTFHLNLKWGEATPAGFHAVNVLLHLAVVLLLFGVIRTFLECERLAFAAALLFGVHPFPAQAVNYVWARSVLLMAVFLLGVLLATRLRGGWWLLLFQLAVWSRAEALVALVPLLLLRPRGWKGLLAVAGFDLAGLGFFLWRYQPQELVWTHPKILEFWAAAGGAALEYLRLMVAPIGLSLYHSSPAPDEAATLLGWLGLAAALAWLYRGRRRRGPVWVGLAGCLLFLAPSLVVPSSQAVSESRGYLAFAGVVVGLVGLIGTVTSLGSHRFRREIGATMLALAVGLSAATTVVRNQVWQSDVAVWSEAATASPEAFAAWYNLGVAYGKAGDVAAARRSFEVAAGLNPGDDMSYAGLGYCLEQEGAWEDALAQYRHALRLNPDSRYALEGSERVSARIRQEEHRQ